MGCASHIDTQQWVAQQQPACLRLRDFTEGNPPDCVRQLVAFEWGVSGNACFFFFYTFQYISHSHKQIRLTNPRLSLFFMSARNALLKSSGRTRRQRAGGLRRVSRSGCWRGWPWWPGSWSAHSLRRNACEGRSTTCLLYPPQPTHHRSWNEGPVCLVGTADDVYSFVPHPLHIPQWTKIPHMWNSWEEDIEEEESLVFVHHLEKSVVIQGHVFLSFTELIVHSIPFSSGSCFVFFPHVCMC